MPTPLIRKVAKENELSVKSVEAVWEKAKEITKKFLRVSSPRFWGTATNIFKARMAKKIKEKSKG